MDKKLFEEFITTSIKLKRLMHDGFGTSPTRPNVTRFTILQNQVLVYISDNPGVTVKNLAGRFLMSSASIAQLLARLISRKLIMKKQDAEDKRITHLYITKSGQEEIVKIKMFIFKKASRILEYIPKEDLRNMIRIQNNLLKQLEKEYKYV